MDGSRFDAWTRRRFGVAAGGFAASLFSIVTCQEPAASKKKKRKRRKKRKERCLSLRVACTPEGTDPCCDGLPCDEVLGTPGFFCCKPPQSRCSVNQECCGNRVCEPAAGLVGDRCCAETEAFCTTRSDCCDVPGGSVGCADNTCTLAL